MGALLVRIGRACEILGISKVELENLIEAGELRPVLAGVGGGRRFVRSEVVRLAVERSPSLRRAVSMETPSDERLIGATEVGQILQVSAATVSKLVANGRLPVARLTMKGQRRFKQEDVHALANQFLRRGRTRRHLVATMQPREADRITAPASRRAPARKRG